MTRITDIIQHYRKDLLNKQSNKERLLHCLKKLYSIDITVDHLKETGIGKDVNKFRKEEGELGLACRALITKWKVMVASQMNSSDSEIENVNDDDKSPPPHNSNNRQRETKIAENIQETKDTSQHKEQKHHGDSGEHRRHKHHSSRHTSSSDKTSDKHHKSGGDKHHGKGHPKIRAPMSPVHNSSSNPTKDRSTDDGDDEESRLIIDIKDKVNSDDKHHKSVVKDRKHGSGGEEHRSDTHKSSRNSEKHKTSDHRSSRDKHADKTSSHQHHRKTETKSSDSTDKPDKRKRKSDEHSEHSPNKSSSNGGASSSKNKKVKIEPAVDEIDSSMGTSFADALGMMMPTTSAKSSKQKKSTKTTTNTAPVTVSKVSPNISEKKPTSAPTKPPTLLSSSAKLPPLPVIAVDFPVISNNYKPMPLNQTVMDCVFNNNNQQQPKKLMTDEEAFGSGTSSKTMRTKVYSGVKSGAITQIPSLYQMCIRVLQKNIDALEEIGFIPFEILRPVLELATPQQLFNIEEFNPHMMDDTDVLWEFHCNRKFRTLKKRDFETWRDMFVRCTEEQEARLNSLTSNIKKSQTVAIPLKQTKLAYVNSPVKPPRGVIKKQNQFGTERKLTATPAARVAALNHITDIAKPGDARLRVAAGIRDAAQVASNPIIRPKKAPLMAKTLKSIRSRFKR